MKPTKTKLKQLIKEEIASILNEQAGADKPGGNTKEQVNKIVAQMSQHLTAVNRKLMNQVYKASGRKVGWVSPWWDGIKAYNKMLREAGYNEIKF